MTAITAMQRDIQDFIIVRAHVCPNTLAKYLEMQDGTLIKYENDNGGRDE